jgi:hypothetical protein
MNAIELVMERDAFAFGLSVRANGLDERIVFDPDPALERIPVEAQGRDELPMNAERTLAKRPTFRSLESERAVSIQLPLQRRDRGGLDQSGCQNRALGVDCFVDFLQNGGGRIAQEDSLNLGRIRAGVDRSCGTPAARANEDSAHDQEPHLISSIHFRINVAPPSSTTSLPRGGIE